MTDTFIQIQHGTPEYHETVALRDAVLRKPLDMEFDPTELAAEKDLYHLACRRDGRILACLILKPMDGKLIRMRQFAVRADLQGTGIGSALLRHAESFAIGHGFGEMVLHARETAAGFYEKMGYQAEGGRFHEVTLPHFLMRKRLTHSE